MIADAGVDQDVMARRFDDEALNAQHEPVVAIEVHRPKPSAILVEQVFAERRKKS